MQTVPRGAGGAIPRPLLHSIGWHPGNGRCPQPPRRRPRSPALATRARPPPPRAPGRACSTAVGTKPARLGAGAVPGTRKKAEEKTMKTLLATAWLVFFGHQIVLAQSTPSSKAVAAINAVSVSCPSSSTTTKTSCSTGWVDVMSAQIKTSNVADLFVSPSLVTGLFTSTTVKGNGSGTTSTSVAMGAVQVRVLLDGHPGFAYPDSSGDGVTFDQRIQTLTAKLGFILTDCIASGGVGCELTPEEIELVLDTTSAHSYNFILLNVGSGVHSVTIQAKASSRSTTIGGAAVSNAMFGLGSLTVDS